MAKKVLDLLLWHPSCDLNLCQVTYKNRGSPGDLKTIPGNKIKTLERGFMILKEDETPIPCHRIIKIKCDHNVIWHKKLQELKP